MVGDLSTEGRAITKEFVRLIRSPGSDLLYLTDLMDPNNNVRGTGRGWSGGV